jgi:hypothetical protein
MHLLGERSGNSGFIRTARTASAQDQRAHRLRLVHQGRHSPELSPFIARGEREESRRRSSNSGPTML